MSSVREIGNKASAPKVEPKEPKFPWVKAILSIIVGLGGLAVAVIGLSKPELLNMTDSTWDGWARILTYVGGSAVFYIASFYFINRIKEYRAQRALYEHKNGPSGVVEDMMKKIIDEKKKPDDVLAVLQNEKEIESTDPKKKKMPEADHEMVKNVLANEGQTIDDPQEKANVNASLNEI